MKTIQPGSEMLNHEARSYIDKLTSCVPDIRQIWLIGSRANESARENSDWDFIVCAASGAFAQIERDRSLHAINIDLLVVDSDGSFARPWGSPKTGSLDSWRWKSITPTQAQYSGTKWIADLEAAAEGMNTLGQLQCNVQNAHLVWDDGQPLQQERVK